MSQQLQWFSASGELAYPGWCSSSREQVGGCCLQHGRKARTQQSQDAGQPQYGAGPVAASSSYPEHNFTQIFTLDSSVMFPLCSAGIPQNRALCPGAQQQGADRGKWCMKQGMAMFTSPVDLLWVSAALLCPVLPPPLEQVMCLPAANTRPSFLQGWSRVRWGGGGGHGGVSVDGSVWRLHIRGMTDRRWKRQAEVSPLLLGLNYVSHPLFSWMGARAASAREHKNSPSSSSRTGKGGESASSAKFTVCLWSPWRRDTNIL